MFFSCQPAETAGPDEQARFVYQAIAAFLETEGGSFESVVTEPVFLRDHSNIEQVRAARSRVFAESKGSPHRPARTEIEQPPLSGADLEVLIHAVLPNASPLQLDSFEDETNCSCRECARSHGVSLRVGQEARFYAGGLYGAGDNAYEQTLAMFEVAEKLLHQTNMEFTDVMRTWIYLPEMERDYADFNRARREFFESRGMRVEESNRVSLLVSGTASLDETGETVYVNDFEGQARRMLLNVEALLKEQGASFSDVASAITYLKHTEDAQRLREIFREAGYEGFPNVLVEAPVCRPELLCETELLAVLPRDSSVDTD